MKQSAKRKTAGSTTGKTAQKTSRTGPASTAFNTGADELLKILDNISEGFIALDEEWRFLYVNGRAEKLIGMRLGDLLGKNLWDVFPAAVGTRFEQECLRAAAGGERAFENFYEPWGRWFHNRCLPRDGGGVSVYFLDITERKKAEEGLCETEERLSLALDAAQMGVFEGDIPNQKVTWSPRTEELWGFKPGEFDGTYEMFANRVHPEDRHVINSKFERCIAEHTPFCYEFRIMWPDGSTRWIACLGRLYCDSQNRPLRLSGVTMDITGRKQSEELLRQGAERLRLALEGARMGTYHWDMGTGEIDCSDTYRAILGQSLESQPSYDKWLSSVHPEDCGPLQQLVLQALQTRGDYDTEYRIILPDGAQRWIAAKGRFYTNADGVSQSMEGVVSDITRRKQAEEALRKSEERFSLAMQGANDGLWDWAITTDEFYYSPRWKSMLGYEEHEIGTGLEEGVSRIHPDDRERVLQRVADFQAGKERTYEIEFRMRHKDGRYVHILSRAFGVRDASGKVVRAVGTHVDITMPKSAVEALRQSEQNYRSLVENNPDIICRYDRQQRIVYLNASGYAITGTTPEESVGKSIREQGLPPDLCAAREACLERAFSGKAVENTFKLTDLTGRERLIWEFLIPERGAGEKVNTVLCVSRDMTELNEATKALRVSEERFRAFMDNSPAIAWAKDEQGRHVYLNRTLESRFEVRSDDWMGKTDFDIWPPEIAAQFRKSDEEVIASGGAVQVEEIAGTPDGTSSAWWVFKFPYRDAQGKLYVGGMGVDITRRKRAEEELKRAHDELERRVLERTGELAIANASLKNKNADMERFMLTVSHDLRSPLITVRTFLGHLVKDQARGDMENFERDLAYINSATEKMSAMLDKLLKLSRIGREPFHASETPLQEIVREALSIVAGRISRGGIRVTVAQEPVLLYGDRAQLVQVFQNLIDNAAKYMGDQAEPRIEIGTGTAHGEQALYVRDNGMGFDPRHKEKLFGLFEKLHADSEGTGMGLALVKRIIEVHGGSIWAESEGTGKGACFWFTLPGNVHITGLADQQILREGQKIGSEA